MSSLLAGASYSRTDARSSWSDSSSFRVRGKVRPIRVFSVAGAASIAANDCHSCVVSSMPDSRQISTLLRSEEHTSELQSLMRISYAVFCLKKKKNNCTPTYNHQASTTQQH